MDLFTYAETMIQTKDGRLVELETTIERGLKTFVDVGSALLEIRDSKLYRKEHSTFEDYCRDRWNISRVHAHRLIEAAEVTINLLPIGNILPATESQARPLTSLEPEQQREAWKLAVETAPEGKVTAEHIQETVNKIKNPVLYSSNSDDWFTPFVIIDRVLKVIPTIDIDPCSNTAKTIPATFHFLKDDDGLSQPWYGTVYMNPPYGDEIKDWINKIVDEYSSGNLTEAVALVPSRTDTAWFRKLRDYPRCFVWGRLKFGNNDTPAPFPSMAVYLGKNKEAFITAFEDIGDVYIHI